jgi:TolA-binding protein
MVKDLFRQIGVALVAAAPFCSARAGDFETAQNALRDRLYPIAQTHAEKALRDSSQDAKLSVAALLILLEAQAAQGKSDEVLKTLEQYQSVARQGSVPAAFAYWRAAALLNAGRAEESARVAEGESRTPSPYADALRRIGARARQASGDLTGALTLYAEIDKTSTNVLMRAENALEWAQALDRSGRVEAALEVLKMQSELGAQSASMNGGALLRGRILLRMGKSSDAAMVLNTLAMNERADEDARVQALVEMSVYAFNGGKTNEAVAYARSAYDCAQKPETRRLAGFRLGDLLSASPASIDEAEKLVKSLVRAYPETPQAMQAQLKLADSLLQAKRPEQAAAEYRIFLETYPSSALDAQVLQGRGWALFQLGRYTEANGVFLRAAELATNDEMRTECRFKQGDALLADARYGEASRVYAKLAEESTNSAYSGRALYQSADCLERLGQRVEACAMYRRVAETYPARDVAPKALLRLAVLQAGANEYEEAVRTYTSIVETFNQKDVRAEAWMGRGKVHYRMYRFDAAMQDFASVAENDPKRRDEARFLLTLCLYGVGRDKEARTAGASFLLDFPESPRLPDMMLWLGKFDFNRGKFTDARKFFLEYVSRWPGNTWADAALLWAARSAFGEADFTGTVELVTRVERDYPQSTRLLEARLVQADALMELARFDEAVLLLDQMVSQSQKGEWSNAALLRKGDCLFALGANNGIRYKEALETYRELLAQENLTPMLRLQLHYKSGRCLEKMKRVDEALDEYYAEVIVRYQEERNRGGWQDDASASLYVRAAFNVAELYEQKSQPEQAVRVLQRVIQSGGPGADEARQRVERLKRKKL